MKKVAPDIDLVVTKLFIAWDITSKEAHEPIVQIREICADDARWITNHPEEQTRRFTSAMSIAQHMLKS